MKKKRTPRFLFAMAVAKLCRLLLRLLGKNASYLPGLVALKLCPDFIARVQKPGTIIGVTGTNGKTTSCNLIINALQEMGKSVLNNKFGSNIDAGIACAFVGGSTLTGKAKFDTAVFEIDERSSVRIYPYMTPDYLLCTNLFRDSIHRNAHTEYIQGIISENVPKTTKLILNADDLISSALAPSNPRVYFGIEPMKSDLPECINIVNDMRVCPKCGADLKYHFVRYHHIGRAYCPECDFASPKADYRATVDFQHMTMQFANADSAATAQLFSDSIYNTYNQVAATALLCAIGTPLQKAVEVLSHQKIIETRFSNETIGEIEVITNMAKGMNSVACCCVFDYVKKAQGTKEVILILDDVFDNRDSAEYICWIYDVDFEFLNDPSVKRIIVGGARCLDYRVRMLLAGIDEEKIVCFDKETDTPNGLQWDADKIYILHELYRNDEAMGIRDDIKNRLRERKGKKSI